MAIDVTQYAQELMTEAGIADAEQRKQLEAFFSNDKVRAKFTNVLTEATEGITRERGRTAAEKTRADKAVADQNTYYQEQLRVYNENKQVFDRTQAQLSAYVEAYGTLPDGSQGTVANINRATQDVIDKKTFEERTTALENNTVGLLSTAMKLMDQHRREFPNEPFDVDGLIKTATEKKLTAAQAYDSLMSEKRTVVAKANEEARIKAAVDAALVEERSKRGAGALSDAAPKSEFMHNLAKASQPQTAQESFLKGWREPEPGKVMKQEFGR